MSENGTIYFTKRKQSSVIAHIFLVATETDLLWEMEKPLAESQTGCAICIEKGADCRCPDLSNTGRASEIMGPRIQSSILIQTDTHNMERPDGLNERQKRQLLPSPQEEVSVTEDDRDQIPHGSRPSLLASIVVPLP